MSKSGLLMGERKLYLIFLLAFASCSSFPIKDPFLKANDDLVEIPAGMFTLGQPKGPRDQRPPHQVMVSAFYIERTLVSVKNFSEFVEATGYVTSAEKRGTGKTSILGMKEWEWREVRGLSWRAPWGESNMNLIPYNQDMPVTMVSWFDAQNYCRWRGRRLPTEAEWEYAMRAGAETRFPWGDEPITSDGKPHLNYWEGKDHTENSETDGWLYLSPIRTYPPNRWGIYDPAGNVWQWVSDWYSKETFSGDAKLGVVTNPRGPKKGTFKVARGGSWWCSKNSCHGYGLVTRGKTRPDASFSNNGFRCAKDRD